MKSVKKYYLHYTPLILVVFAFLIVQAYFDLALPDYMSRMISEGVAASDTKLIWKLGGIMLGYSAIVMTCAIVVGYLGAYIGSRAAKTMREDIFKTVSSFSGAEFDRFTVSSLITRSTNDVTQVLTFSIMLIRIALYAPIIGIGGIIKAVQKSQGMTSLAIVIVIAVVVLLASIVVLLLVAQPKFMRLQKIIDKLNLTAREGLNGMMVVRAFNTQEHEEERFHKVNKDLTHSTLFVNRIMSALMPIIMLIMNGVSIAVFWVASMQATDVIMLGNTMAFVQYAMQIIMAFMMLTMVFVIMPRALVSAKRITEVLRAKSSIGEPLTAREATDIKGEVTFDNVCFKYGDSEANVLENISFTARPGETTAIIGSTGSGKSSIINLIPRLYDCTSGKITIDGVDVKDYGVQSLRDRIGFVPQKNILFSGTVKSNIKYADDNYSDEQMQDAAQTAQAEEFISSMTEGYDSQIAQGGGNVSGGQKQRLAIARAIIKQAPVLVFDDSFSALDFKTDANLRKALNDKTASSTKIIVAQRVGTIMNADQILVVDEGKIVGKGRHDELMASCPVYADIAKSQLSMEELGL